MNHVSVSFYEIGFSDLVKEWAFWGGAFGCGIGFVVGLAAAGVGAVAGCGLGAGIGAGLGIAGAALYWPDGS